MKTVLVTGGRGFIGGYVVERLRDLDYEPVIFDRRHKPDLGVEQFWGDIRDPHAVSEAVAHADAVIHLAGVLGTQETIEKPTPAAEVNIAGGLNVFEACAAHGVPCVYIAVGNHWEQNTYSITKTTVERFAQMYNQYRDTSIAIVRVLNAYGPRQVPAAPYGPSKVRKVMPAFVCRALAGDPIEIYGDGSQVMDMVHVRDVARTLVRALEVGPSARIYECGSGRPTCVTEIAEAVVAEVGQGEIVYLPMRPGESGTRPVLADPTTLSPLTLGPFTSLEEGLPETVAYYKEHV